jgi:hypothetical protein
MIKEYQKPQPLLAYDEKLGKFLPRFASTTVDYLNVLPWGINEHIDGIIVCIHWDGKKVEWSGEGKEPLPSAVDDLLHDKFDDTEKVFTRLFNDKEVHLFVTAYGGKINNGAYGGKERLIGIDAMIDNNYIGKGFIKQAFDAFDIASTDFFQVKNLQEAVTIVQRGGVSKYNLKGSETPISGLVCHPLERLYTADGKRICTLIKATDLANVYDPNAQPVEEAKPKKAKKTAKKPN